MSNFKTSISKDEFLSMSHEEQSYLIYGAVEGHEERLMGLEEKTQKSPIVQSLPGIFGGFLGGFAAVLATKVKGFF